MTGNSNDGNGQAQRASSPTKDRLAAIITAFVLVGFGAFIIYLLTALDANELGWARRTYLFAAVEAIAFAAVGWLFGREVHRERAESAEERAEKEKQRADDKADQAQVKEIETAQYRDRGRLLKERIGGVPSSG